MLNDLVAEIFQEAVDKYSVISPEHKHPFFQDEVDQMKDLEDNAVRFALLWSQFTPFLLILISPYCILPDSVAQ